MNEIKCPHDLNQFVLGEPIFEDTFPEEECEQRKILWRLLPLFFNRNIKSRPTAKEWY